MSICSKCLFSSQFCDMGASCLTCSLVRDLSASINFRAKYEGRDDCPYCLFFCDLVDALSRSTGLPDPDVLNSYSYVWSLESKGKSRNSDLDIDVFFSLG